MGTAVNALVVIIGGIIGTFLKNKFLFDTNIFI